MFLLALWSLSLFHAVQTLTPGTYLVGTTPAQCPQGTFCPGDGTRELCPAGRYGSTFALFDQGCSGPCPAGYTCPRGTINPTANPCFDAFTLSSGGVYCPQGSGVPLPVSPGFYSTPGGADQLPCPKGSWCRNGLRALCMAGVYGETEGLATQSCTGKCRQGYFCPPGSVSALQTPCGGPQFYCPAGSGSPTPVPPGCYSVKNSTDYVVRRVTGSSVVVGSLVPPPLPLDNTRPSPPVSCPAAWSQASELVYLAGIRSHPSIIPAYADAPEVWVDPSVASMGSLLTQDSILQCPPGTLCKGGVVISCPKGQWCGDWGLVAPSGECFAGFYCPPGSVRPNQRVCGNESFVCPGGAGEPTLVPSGFYSAGGGFWGALGSPTSPPKPSTSFGVPETLLPPGVGVCGGEGGMGGGPAATHLIAHPALPSTAYLLASPFYSAVKGMFSGGAWEGLLRTPCGPPVSSQLAAVANSTPIALACQGLELGGPRTRSIALVCPLGFTCRGGLLLPCPGGNYGGKVGESSPQCGGGCLPGFYCPPTLSTNATAFPCTLKRGGVTPDPSVYCPPSSSYPLPASPGYFTFDSSAPLDVATALTPNLSTSGGGSATPLLPWVGLRSSQFPCPTGYWCSLGEIHACPPGVFGNTQGLSVSQCSGVCPPGFQCPLATSHPIPCGGGGSLYCPAGSPSPLPVTPGYFSVGADPAHPQLAATNATRSSQLICEAGWFCSGGIARECPGGWYSGERGQGACSVCSPGHFCPPGSTTPTPYRCGDAYLALVDVLSSVPLQAALAANPTLPDIDSIPVTSPSYTPTRLAALYRVIAGAGGLSIGVGSGEVGWGEWQVSLSTPPPLASDPMESAVYRAGGGHGTPTTSPAISLSLAFLARSVQVSALLPAASLSDTVVGTLVASSNSPLVEHRNGGLGSVSGWGSSSGRVALQVSNVTSDTGPTLRNFTATIPWRSGLRLKLPTLTLPINSFAAVHRALLLGGPSSVFCPPGSPWPTPIPPGSVGATSPAALNATTAAALATLAALNASGLAGATSVDPTAEAIGASAMNTTQDGYVPSPPGWFSRNGIAEPCQVGYFQPLSGATSPTFCTLCSAGFACPTLGTPLQIPCNDGQYASAGAAACKPCPALTPGGQTTTPVGLVESGGLDEADQLWPGVTEPGAVPGVGGLPAALPLARCKTSIACCE